MSVALAPWLLVALAVDATDVPRDGRSRDIKVTVATRNTKVALKPKSVRILQD